MPKCNLLIPGFAKSGTSSLHGYLALHPDVCMSGEKEPQFFSMTAQWQRGFDWYDSLFDDAGRSRRWYGESSQSYNSSEPALKRIKAYLKEPRFIVLLRHPVDRLLSQYRWCWAYGWESRPLVTAVQEEEKNGMDVDAPAPDCYRAYRLGSDYARLCPLMERYFDRERILYLDSDQLATNPQETLNRCYQFLEIEPRPIGTEIRANATESIRVWRRMGFHLLLKPVPLATRERLDPGGRWRRRVRVLLGQKKRKPPEISDHDKEYLTQLLAEDIAFYEQLFPDSQKAAPRQGEESAARA